MKLFRLGRFVMAALLVAVFSVPSFAQGKLFVIGGGGGIGTAGVAGVGTSGPDVATDFHIGVQPTRRLAITYASKTLFDTTRSGFNISGPSVGVALTDDIILRGVVGAGWLFADDVGVTRFGSSFGIDKKVAAGTYVTGDLLYGRFYGMSVYGVKSGITFARR